MKKRLLKIILLSFISLFVFAACSHSSEDTSNSDLRTVQIVINTAKMNDNCSRTALYTMPELNTITYTVTAEKDGNIQTSETPLTGTTATYQLILEPGTWTITVEGKDAGGNLILSNEEASTAEKTLVVGSDGKYEFTVNVTTIKTTGSTGSVSLPITVNGTSISKLIVSGTGDTVLDGTYTVSSGVITIDKAEVPAGNYNASLIFKDSNDVFVFAVNETINVRKNLTTNKWIKNWEEPYLQTATSSTSSNFVITEDLINTICGTIFYVNSSVTDITSANGTWISPYKTLNKAIERIVTSTQSSGTTFTIFVSGDVDCTETAGTALTISERKINIRANGTYSLSGDINITSSEPITIESPSGITGNLSVTGSQVAIENPNTITGNINVSTSSQLSIQNPTGIAGNITVSDSEATIVNEEGSTVNITGTVTATGTSTLNLSHINTITGEINLGGSSIVNLHNVLNANSDITVKDSSNVTLKGMRNIKADIYYKDNSTLLFSGNTKFANFTPAKRLIMDAGKVLKVTNIPDGDGIIATIHSNAETLELGTPFVEKVNAIGNHEDFDATGTAYTRFITDNAGYFLGVESLEGENKGKLVLKEPSVELSIDSILTDLKVNVQQAGETNPSEVLKFKVIKEGNTSALAVTEFKVEALFGDKVIRTWQEPELNVITINKNELSSRYTQDYSAINLKISFKYKANDNVNEYPYEAQYFWVY